MKTVLWLVLLAALVWKFSPEIESLVGGKLTQLRGETVAVIPEREAARALPSAVVTAFQCDGRKYCSQMTSCAEAKKFLQNCPGMQMDGDNDGIPCESQWCH